MELCGPKAILKDECEKCLAIADQYVQNEERLAAAQRWWATASEVQKTSPQGQSCWGDITACLQYQTTYKQEGYAAYQEVWISRIEPFQRALERFSDDIVTPGEYEGFAQACRCAADLIARGQPLLTGSSWQVPAMKNGYGTSLHGKRRTMPI